MTWTHLTVASIGQRGDDFLMVEETIAGNQVFKFSRQGMLNQANL